MLAIMSAIHIQVTLPYPILRAHLLAAHALLHAARPAPNQTIPLKGLVILDMLRELAERIGARRALGAAEERHGGKEDAQNVQQNAKTPYQMRQKDSL